MIIDKFPEKLIDQYIDLMQSKYGVVRSKEEAETDLDSLGDLFLVLASKNKQDQGQNMDLL